MAVGDLVDVDVLSVAHGGHCIARHEGQVLFVRHGLPGERVRVRVTSIGRRARFVRADVVEVLLASPDRRDPPCPVARDCGGCDWQHALPAAQRRLKAAVVREAMARFAGIDLPESFAVQAVADPAATQAQDAPAEGLGWRTRGTLGVDRAGRAGFLGHRSHDVVVAGECLQLHPRLDALALFGAMWSPGSRVGFVAPSAAPAAAFPESDPPTAPVTEHAAGRDWSVAADGFWQVHPGAADALVGHVRRMLDPRAGERLVDLYAGVGLFGLSLAQVDPAGLEVTLVEGDRRACELAAGNAGAAVVTVVRSGADRWVARAGALEGVDIVVLDPPRTGAGAAVATAIAAAGPRAVAYVACDPVALARDLATFRGNGLVLDELVALDLFPTTHHVECVAKLIPQ
ncbi:MAG: methyltransferase [Candidatus Nanopelagicales bacterium]|jgi:tRNA/tmRNA/rRNA uracil-C5-methylase (TrmA/RlmC/RlmD family)|nr:methyltransferase [Candidatus Nanopelagicales bacterium]